MLRRNYQKIILEDPHSNLASYIKADKIIVHTKSAYQDILLFSSKFLGKVLKLDDAFQTSEKDEFFYHEILVHPALTSHPFPQSVLIIGGGDGGALEEVLKHRTVQKVIMIEIDKIVIDLAKKYLKSIHKNAFYDKRVTLLIEDGKKFITNTDQKFDIVILDLTDPVGPSVSLYTKEFYKNVKKILTQNGILSLHAEFPFITPQLTRGIVKTLKGIFKYTTIFLSDVPIYPGMMAFLNCSSKINGGVITTELIKKRLKEREVKGLQLYSPEIHHSLMVLPPYLKKML